MNKPDRRLWLRLDLSHPSLGAPQGQSGERNDDNNGTGASEGIRVGRVGVNATLIYLTVQIRQNT